MIERMKSALVGAGATWVLWLMLVLSVISLAIMLERAWLYISLHDSFDTLMRDLGRLLRSGDLKGARKRLEASRSAEAAVVVAGLVEADQGPDAAEEAMVGASALQKIKLEKRLNFLGTLGNNAPFIGLLGTVIGIVGAFDELGKANTMAPGGSSAASQVAPQAVMNNIAEALVATAVGLFVAIPAVAAFNFFQRVVKTKLANTEAMRSLVLAHLRSVPALATGGTASDAESSGRESRSKEPSKGSGRAHESDGDD